MAAGIKSIIKMEAVSLNLNENGRGGFYIMDGEEEIGEMLVKISGENLRVFHTEVAPKAEGKGLAKQMLNAMVDYARKNHMKVIALCPYVHAQFTHHPDEYADVWNKE